MIKFKIIENFLTPEDCKNLINDAETLFNKIGDRQILNNNRETIQSTSLKFQRLLDESKYWNKLNINISSQKFFDRCLSQLNEPDDNFVVTNFFSPKNISKFHKKYKTLQSKKIGFLSNYTIFKVLIMRIYLYLKRIISYKFAKKKYLELLYDYSKAQNGYSREVHRDSDSRTLVFLIYLNSLSEDAKGGSLILHEYKDKTKISPQPDIEECNLLKKIEPKEGRMVFFLNSDDSLHSVEKMSGHSDYRYFIYGSFTLLGKKNPLIKKSKKKLKTEFHLFD